jgi:hypothetical protein
MPSVKDEPPDCGHTPDLDLSDEVKEERRRCIITLLPIMTAIQHGAPQSVQFLMGMTLSHLLDLCPAHSSDEDQDRALAAIGVDRPSLDTLQAGGAAFSLTPFSRTRGTA